MLRNVVYSCGALLGLLVATEAARAQVVYPSLRPGYTPNFRYQYGYGVYPSYYYNGPAPIVTPQVQIYSIEFRRNCWDYWRTFGRSYNLREAQNYAAYLRRQGFDARVHNHP